MNLTIYHYEPDNDEPYDVEIFKYVSDFRYDSRERSIYFELPKGRVYSAAYNHRVEIHITGVTHE